MSSQPKALAMKDELHACLLGAIELARTRADIAKGCMEVFIGFITLEVSDANDMKEAIAFLKKRGIEAYTIRHNCLEIHRLVETSKAPSDVPRTMAEST